jgi:hypothetical protein
MYNIWTTVDLSLPNGDLLVIPDLYASDSGGLINEELYGLVNLSVYLNSVVCNGTICEVPFTQGETFNIVNGQTALLPGMMFSTDPWTFTPAGGFMDPGAYNGQATQVTQHDLPSMPEPGSSWLLGAGFAAIFGLARSRTAQLYRSRR